MVIEIDDVTIEEFDGHYFATAGTLTRTDLYADGTVSQDRKTVQRSNIQLNPDFSALGAFEIDFPEGSRVTYWFGEDGRLFCVWRNNQLLPRVDLDAIAQIDDFIATFANLQSISSSGLTARSAVSESDTERVSNEIVIPLDPTPIFELVPLSAKLTLLGLLLLLTGGWASRKPRGIVRPNIREYEASDRT